LDNISSKRIPTGFCALLAAAIAAESAAPLAAALIPLWLLIKLFLF